MIKSFFFFLFITSFYFLALLESLSSQEKQKMVTDKNGKKYEFKVIEQSASQFLSTQEKDEPRYAMIIIGASELKGYLRIDKQGNLRLSGAAYVEDNHKLRPENIKAIRILPKIIIRFRNGNIAVGHFLRQDAKKVTFENLDRPAKVVHVQKQDIAEMQYIKGLTITEKDPLQKVTISAAFLKKGVGFDETIQNGFAPILSYDLDLRQLWQLEQPFIPKLRVNLAMVQYQQDDFKYRSLSAYVGGAWYMRPWHKRYGSFIATVTAGVGVENLSLPSGSKNGVNFVSLATLGYEVPLRYISLTCFGLALYHADKANPLFGYGVGLGIAYSL